MKLTREEALKYHRQMWGDMLKDIGDIDNANLRTNYKAEWCKKHFPGENIDNYCFCCEYDLNTDGMCCVHCPIEWPKDEDGYPNCCNPIFNGEESGEYYLFAPISEILALPEREVEDGQAH